MKQTSATANAALRERRRRLEQTMGSKGRGQTMWGYRVARAIVLALFVIVGAGAATTGCRITESDVEKWGKKSAGPRKLVAVLSHDKYDMELRVEAAMTLVTMPARGGRSVGLLGGDDYEGLLSALEALPPKERAPIIEGMTPRLVEGMKGGIAEDGTDSTIPYKDAAYALLTTEDGSLIPNKQVKTALENALVEWVATNFVERFDNTSQNYGMEQVLRLLREQGVRKLTPLIDADFKKLRELANLIRELGDDASRLEASKRLVEVAQFVDSPKWIEKKKDAVAAANKASGLDVTEKQFQAQLNTYQQEELLRVFSAMKSVGMAPAVEYLIAYAQNKEHPERRRAAALAALEGNLDRKNPEHAKAMLDFVSSDETPDVLRDVAARRVGELSREQVADRLYALFGNKRWQVRWTVASLLLKMSEAKHLDQFMDKLGSIEHMAMSEPLSYGPLLEEVKGAKPDDLAQKYAARGKPAPVRLSALGYYYEHGTVADLAKVEKYKNDSTKVPQCPPDANNCSWSCTVQEKDKPVAKEVNTLGQYVEYCIMPAMKGRQPEKSDGEPEADEK